MKIGINEIIGVQNSKFIDKALQGACKYKIHTVTRPINIKVSSKHPERTRHAYVQKLGTKNEKSEKYS